MVVSLYCWLKLNHWTLPFTSLESLIIAYRVISICWLVQMQHITDHSWELFIEAQHSEIYCLWETRVWCVLEHCTKEYLSRSFCWVDLKSFAFTLTFFLRHNIFSFSLSRCQLCAELFAIIRTWLHIVGLSVANVRD